ncbi:related to vegetatible incompatibility protein HET-E-1 [Serendipita indica DSM 11827]|uniref:Related to vegetatible incompatibility protein HET-E-1 n=1 Tax=Serendipita indica (strain DSM 11827) TaxID=1109443 RepID=G4TVN7_SERID|nr:related to vegetatible incompatibility protein HET-E-1 [Serendipita indica DSM 11827]
MSTRKSNKPKQAPKSGNSSPSSSVPQSPSNKKQRLIDTVNLGLEVVATISEGSDVLAPLKAASKTTKLILETIQAIENNQEEWTDLRKRLRGYLSTLEKQITLFESYPREDRAVDKAFSQPLIDHVEFMEEMHDKIVHLKEKHNGSKLGFFKALSKVKVDAGEIHKLNRDIEDQHRQFMEALGVFTALRVQALENKINASTILQLPAVAFVASSVHSTCLEGTRKDVLQMICDWAENDSSEKPIFWLCDIAGSGKSTVAMSVAESWQEKGILGGAFFFSMSSTESSTTEKFCSTIARDLVDYIPELAPHVAEAVKQNPSILRKPLDKQLQILVVGPLDRWQERVILVIDALDECKSGSQRRELIEALSTAVQGSKNLKIFMTSRPDPVIQAVLGSLSIKAKSEDRLHDVSHPDNVDDIAVYVHRSLDGVLPEDKRQRLVGKANGLFIWASTACRMLTNEATMNSHESIYDQLISLDQCGAIDEVYGLIFERTDPDSRGVMCQMLAMLLAAFEPLTIGDLDDRLKHAGLGASGQALVQNLGSVLSTESSTNLIQFRHPTLVEYLRRCSLTAAAGGGNKLYIDITNAHGQAASWCLQYLKSPTNGLKFNICRLESSFHLNRQIPDIDARVSKFISKRLRYASSHWLFHASEADENWRRRLKNEASSMIRIPYVLYWTEVLSLTGGVPRAIAGLRAVTRDVGTQKLGTV